MLKRWYFRWCQDDSLDNKICALPCSGMLEGAYLIEKSPSLIVIGFRPEFWKPERGTWSRQAVRKAIVEIAGCKPPRPLTRNTMMVWSNDEENIRKTEDIVRLSRFPREEAALVWHWTATVLTMPSRLQKSSTLFEEEFKSWRKKTEKSRLLPDPPQRSRFSTR